MRVAEIVHHLEGVNDGIREAWRPRLALREQRRAINADPRPLLYVHGATFPSAASVMLRLDGISWADSLNAAGLDVWALDFAGFGGSERYPEMAGDVRPESLPVGRATEAAEQIERAVRFIIARTGVARLCIVAHSWGTIVASLFATRQPALVEKLVLFGPILQRQLPASDVRLGSHRFVTSADQHARFVEDVPHGEAQALLDRHFESWKRVYLVSDPSSATRSPASVAMPSGPVADVMAAWSGALPYEAASIAAPLLVVRGEWDGLCTDMDVERFMAALTSSPKTQDVKIPRGTHLMHLEESRALLYLATEMFLNDAG